MVAGEKQIAINREQDFIRLSGVVNPADIDNSNAVPSTKVADARIEQRGQGTVDSAQIMGWLARFFASVIPFSGGYAKTRQYEKNTAWIMFMYQCIGWHSAEFLLLNGLKMSHLCKLQTCYKNLSQKHS